MSTEAVLVSVLASVVSARPVSSDGFRSTLSFQPNTQNKEHHVMPPFSPILTI